MILAENLTTPDISHGFFTRAGGVSQGIYASRNCGMGSKDDRGNVAANRSRTADDLGTVAENLLTVYQIHSATAVVAGKPWTYETAPKADAIVTATPGLAIAVLTADCVPVLFADTDNGIVGAAHSGWRGALDGVLDETVRQMQLLGAEVGAIRASVGPAISQAAYEVGEEFQERFMEAAPRNKTYFTRPNPDGRPYFDLPRYVVDRLKNMGITDISHINQCTYGEPWTYETAPKADAIVTVTPGLAIAVLTADCVPVLFADTDNGIVGAAHSGWRGALDGVLDETVRQMQLLGAEVGAIRASVGPAISQAAYEVGEEFQERFMEAAPRNKTYFTRPNPDGRPYFDLPRYVVDRLKNMGITDISHINQCTYGDESQYFSYRRSVTRGEPDYGRQISAIMVR